MFWEGFDVMSGSAFLLPKIKKPVLLYRFRLAAAFILYLDTSTLFVCCFAAGECRWMSRCWLFSTFYI